MSDTKDLDVLFPEATTVTVGGEKIAVTPIKVGQLSAFMRALGPAAGDLAALPEDLSQVSWFELVARHGDAFIAAAAIACGRPREWVERLDLDEFVRLVASVVTVNADFFTARVVPAFLETARLVSGTMRGRTPSSTSSPQDTA